MATRRNPRFKECRRLGVNVCGHPKAMNRANDPAFKKTHKVSEYGLQLIEKQKVKAYYGIMERQLQRYFALASKAEGKTGAALIELLECRLDNLVYRLGFATSIRMARQDFAPHGKRQDFIPHGCTRAQRACRAPRAKRAGILSHTCARVHPPRVRAGISF